jgi:hypothetical protein
MYYMTGEELHAREFIRLAFPDEQARREITEIDGERIENKDEPLSGPYHYNAHMMILFWDLIEESPLFTDEERLRVTNAFSKQLDHRKGEGIYGRTVPPRAVGSRHGQWSAVSLYCLGRYFQKDYPDPIWRHCVDSAQLHFRPLHEHAWVGGESDNLFWYNTGIAPIFTYLLLSGERKPLQNGVAATLLRGQEMLISGRQPDWALNSASVGYLHKAAYLTGDGRYLSYRQRTGVDTDVFRLGQSFWPDERLTPRTPEDLAGQWSINALPKPMWRARRSGLEFEESFQFGSFRSSPDAAGDFILIDGYNGASRNPYHTFAILELRLGGYTLLSGYRNQVLTRADGLVAPRIAMDAALKHHDVLGATATATVEVPAASFCSWKRTLAQRIGRYSLIADELAFRADANNMEVQIMWETENSAKTFADGHVEFTAPIEAPTRRTERGGQIWPSRLMKTTSRRRVAEMQWCGPAKKGESKAFFSLVGVQAGAAKATLGCLQLTDNAAALALPDPALAVIGRYEGVQADFAVVAADHCFGKQLRAVALPASTDDGASTTNERRSSLTRRYLLSATVPVDLDWDFATGVLHVTADEPTRLQLVLESGEQVRVNGERLSGAREEAGATLLDLSAGRHKIDGATPASSGVKELASWLSRQLVVGRENRARTASAVAAATTPELPSLTAAMTADVGGAVADLRTIPQQGGAAVCAVEGKAVHILSLDGKELQTLEADGPVRMVRWWPQHQLLLAGCSDEQVIAFGLDGTRKWVFTSEMDPAVFRAAKSYWFKSAPGHEGIHGLHADVFLDGKSQAFVGSACTLEIVDEHGKLIRRMPQFWGKVSHFAMIDGADGSLNLLASRKYNGTNRVGIINNRTLDPRPRGFNSVPSGSTYVPGWSSMNRHHLFYEDLDGDGVKEVTSEINGTWNRVTVWSAAGKPLYDASFGPGERIPAKNMRDLDVADLDGDGKKEIVAATSGRLIVTLDHQCRKLWATRLASAPTVMTCVRPKSGSQQWVVVGCENGRLIVLDAKGKMIRAAKVSGRPTCIDVLEDPSGAPLVLLATDTGQVYSFRATD